MGAGKRHTPTESDQASQPDSQPPNTPQEIVKPQKRDDGSPRNPNKRRQYIEKTLIPTPPSPQTQICAATKSVGSSQIATSCLWYPLLRPKPQHFFLSLTLCVSLSVSHSYTQFSFGFRSMHWIAIASVQILSPPFAQESRIFPFPVLVLVLVPLLTPLVLGNSFAPGIFLSLLSSSSFPARLLPQAYFFPFSPPRLFLLVFCPRHISFHSLRLVFPFI